MLSPLKTLEQLDLTFHNTAQTERFLAQHLLPFILPDWTVPDAYQLLTTQTGDETRLIHRGTRKTVYALKRIFRNRLLFNHPELNQGNDVYAELLVWETKDPSHDSVMEGLTHRFFDYFSQRCNLIIQDEHIILDYRRFYLRRVAYALWRHQQVYLVTHTQHSMQIEKIDDYETFFIRWEALINNPDTTYDEIHTVIMRIKPYNYTPAV